MPSSVQQSQQNHRQHSLFSLRYALIGNEMYWHACFLIGLTANRELGWREMLLAWCLGFWSYPGRVLKDTLGAGVVNELLAADQAFPHGDPAPGAEAIGKFR